MKEWKLYIDGASLGNPGSSGAGIVAYDEDGKEAWHESIFLGDMTNNMAEYEALIRGLRTIPDPALAQVAVFTDSQLVAFQMIGLYKVRNPVLQGYVNEARKLVKGFAGFRIQHIGREANRLADSLAKKGAKRKGVDVWSRESTGS